MLLLFTFLRGGMRAASPLADTERRTPIGEEAWQPDNGAMWLVRCRILTANQIPERFLYGEAKVKTESVRNTIESMSLSLSLMCENVNELFLSLSLYLPLFCNIISCNFCPSVDFMEDNNVHKKKLKRKRWRKNERKERQVYINYVKSERKRKKEGRRESVRENLPNRSEKKGNEIEEAFKKVKWKIQNYGPFLMQWLM